MEITKSTFLGQNSGGGEWGDKLVWLVGGIPPVPPLWGAIVCALEWRRGWVKDFRTSGDNFCWGEGSRSVPHYMPCVNETETQRISLGLLVM